MNDDATNLDGPAASATNRPSLPPVVDRADSAIARPIAQWSRLNAGRSDDLTVGS